MDMTNEAYGKPAPWPSLPAEKPDIRLIAVDLDDTLLTDELVVTPRTKKAIQAAKDKGVVFTIATGRVFDSALPYALELGVDVPLITFQGAMVVWPDGRIVSHRPMDHDVSLEVLDYLLATGHHVTLYIGEELYIEETSPATDSYRKRIRIKFNIVPSLRLVLAACPDGATKFVMMAEPDKVREMAAAVRERFGDRLQAVTSRPDFLEISRADTGKGVALAVMADSLGIAPDQVMAIGDSPNDADMIVYAGWGICMANGVEELKEKARWITASNNEDGVAIAIEHLVLR